MLGHLPNQWSGRNPRFVGPNLPTQASERRTTAVGIGSNQILAIVSFPSPSHIKDRTMAIDTITICDCGHSPSEHSDITTGYGTDDNGKTLCYDCCTQRDLEQIDESKPGEKIYHYVGKNWSCVSNWPGRFLMKIHYVGNRHNLSSRYSMFGERRYFQAIDSRNRVWRGIGSPGMYAILTLTKQRYANGKIVRSR